MKYAFALVLFFSSMLNQIAAADDILWYRFNFPPYYIQHGPMANQGVADYIERDIKRYLDAYEHRSDYANFKRTTADMKAGKHVCSTAILKTKEREEFVEFSNPYIVTYSNGIVVRKESLENLKGYMLPDKTVDVDAVLRAGKISVGVTHGRSYGQDIDVILRRPENNTLLVINQQGGIQGLLNMMAMGRVDGVLGYAGEFKFFIAENDIEIDLVWMPISQARSYFLGYTGCSKNEWGKTVIRNLNEFFEKPETRNNFAKYYAEWLNEGMRADYFEFAKSILD